MSLLKMNKKHSATVYVYFLIIETHINNNNFGIENSFF